MIDRADAALAIKAEVGQRAEREPDHGAAAAAAEDELGGQHQRQDEHRHIEPGQPPLAGEALEERGGIDVLAAELGRGKALDRPRPGGQGEEQNGRERKGGGLMLLQDVCPRRGMYGLSAGIRSMALDGHLAAIEHWLQLTHLSWRIDRRRRPPREFHFVRVAEIHRTAGVENEVERQVLLLVEDAHEEAVEPRVEVPVDRSRNMRPTLMSVNKTLFCVR